MIKDQADTEKTVIALFEAQVKKTPKNIALVADQETLDYATLNARANRLAHYLREQGVGPEILVGLHLGRSVEAIIVILAILKAGGAYLPLDLNDPLSRLQFILKNSACDFLIVPSFNELSENIDKNTLKLIVLDEITEALAQQSDGNLSFIAELQHLAYVIYTSGSTGQPKGVEIEHRGLPNFAKAQIAKFEATEHSRVLQFSALHFDASVFELWFTLLSGASLYIPTDFVRSDPVSVLDYMCNHKISIAAVPPSILLGMPCKSYPELKKLITVADVCPKKVLDGWKKECHVLNAYGPTEITVCATIAFYDGKYHQCIGQALPNVQCYVLNEDRKELKIGEVGELYIGGIGLARGYRNRPDLTHQTFIDWQSDKEAEPIRLYKTGDRVKQLPDGRLDYMGRADFQIKFHGVRIDPAEIETPLNEHPLVSRSLVMLKKHRDREYLVAYVILKQKVEDKSTVGDALREYLRKILPVIRLPNVFMVLDAFPLLSTDKVDRNALPMPVFNELSEGKRVLTKDETILSVLWAEVLNISKKSIGPDSNFFTLGGSSLLATQLALRLSDQWSITLTSADIFEYPILKNQVMLRDLLTQRTSIPLLTAQLRPASLPLSFAQRRLWLAYQMLKNQRPQTYNVNLQLKFEGDLDQSVLQRALQSLIDRHEILRTYFPAVGVQAIGQYQFVLEKQSVNIKIPNQQEELKKVIQEFCDYDFGDLTALPLMRGMLIEVNQGLHILCLLFHHIIIDGTALPLFTRELKAFYNSYLKQSPSHLMQLPIQYADFALWEQQCLAAGCYKTVFDYWKQQLGGTSGILDLPFDKQRPEYPTYEGGSHILYFSKMITDELKGLAQQQGVPLFTLLLSSIAVLFYRYNQQEDIVLGVAYGKRPHPGLNQLIGFFVNMLPIRIQQDNQASFLQVLAQLQKTLSEAYKHSAPLEEIMNQLDFPHHSDRHPLFQVSVTMHDSADLALDFVGASTSLLEPSLITSSDLFSSKFDLGFEMECLADGRLAVKIEYAKDLFFIETIQRISRQWLRLCESLIKTPHDFLDALSLLNEEEKQQQLAQWFRPTVCISPQETIVSLFQEQVQRSPDAIAIVDDEIQLTYRELNEQANRLAHYLLQTNTPIKADTCIAILLNRSAAFVVSVLAVLKTGAAYLPLDPESPAQRLQFMLEDAQVQQLIADRESVKNIPNIQIKCVFLDDESVRCALLKQANTNPDVKVDPQNLSYVIYTSGSTGKPKGVMIEHRNVVQLVKNISYMSLTQADHVAHVCNVTFDVSVFEIFACLLNGARLVVFPKLTLLNPPLFKRALVEQSVSVLVLPTAVFYRLLVSDITVFSSVNYVLFIGEKLMSTKVLVELFKKPGQAPHHLINVYGPTEDTVFSTSYEIKCNHTNELPIGSPMKNTQVYVLDLFLQPVAEGTLGELYLGGTGLARGYLNRRELTQQRFILNPFANDNSRLYRTGDLVRYQANGNLIFVKRIDQQVKISGHRVELEEIEKALLSQSHIKEALVLKKVVDGLPMLIAYIVLKINLQDSHSTEELREKLREDLSQTLPHYMLPSVFVLMEALPLNSNNKIDRDQLLAVKFKIGHEYVPPTTVTEKKLVKLWQSVLSFQKKIGIQDNFFILGGTSLLAMQLASLVHQKFGPISYSDLFVQPTIQSQAQLIETPERQRITPTKDIEYFKQEAVLDKNIQLSVPWETSTYLTHPKAIFLTGVTGFLGVFLLDELLKTTDAIIYCLVRARDKDHAKSRFLETLKKYRLDIPDHYESRICWVIGDIEKIDLGLSKKDYDELASQIEMIYHSASAVNFVKPYSALKNANVEGVKHILRFAISKKIKPVHYVSSASVFTFAHYFKERKVLFEEEIEWDEAYAKALPHDLGYVQSKAVAEKLVWQAKARGIPVTIHRSGFILCHSQTGAGSSEQLWAMFIKDCLPLGTFPHFLEVKGEFITVDYASRAIVRISQRMDCVGKVFHIVPTPEDNMTTDQLFNLAEKLGSPLKAKPLAEWRQQLQRYIDSGHPSALALLMPLFKDPVESSLTLFEAYQCSPEYSISNTQAALENSDIVGFPINANILSCYLAYLLDRGEPANKVLEQSELV